MHMFKKTRKHGLTDEALEQTLRGLLGKPNNDGGVIAFSPRSVDEVRQLGFAEFMLDRHSVRTFAGERVDINRVKDAISLAQHTPSACNRQGWRVRIVESRNVIEAVLSN